MKNTCIMALLCVAILAVSVRLMTADNNKSEDAGDAFGIVFYIS